MGNEMRFTLQCGQLRSAFNLYLFLNFLYVVIAKNNIGEFRSMRWGLIPNWQVPGKPIRLNNNARLETVDSLSTFKRAFKSWTV
jgi:putative SOS response-associated peptidase YedK